MKSIVGPVLVLFVFIAFQLLSGRAVGSDTFALNLTENWRIQSSAKTRANGEQLSSVFDASSWYATDVPSTVLGALVKNSEYPDIFFGKNLESVPAERFSVPWWYRVEFDLTDTDVLGFATLVFEGLNYRADVWLNGRQIGKSDSVFGAFRQFAFDVSGLLADGKNILAIRIQPPQPGDFTIGFVDWNPEPPDHNMGIWRGVRLERNRCISIEKPFITTDLDTADLKTAKITISAILKNHSDSDIKGEVTGRIGDITVNQSISLKGNEE
jgi:exo-1,4-beta-D-glucosaminidase